MPSVTASQVKESWLNVHLCQVGTKDCQLSNSTNPKGVLRLPKHSNEETVYGLDIQLVYYSNRLCGLLFKKIVEQYVGNSYSDMVSLLADCVF